MILSQFIFNTYMNLIHAPLWKIGVSFSVEKSKNISNNKIAIFDTSISTDNVGDYIIMDYCNKVIHEIFLDDFTYSYIPVQKKPNHIEMDMLNDSNIKIVCGTNLLRSKMSNQNQWKFSYPMSFYNNMLLLGVGWNSYENKLFEKQTIHFYNKFLSKKYIHSVRDNYTKLKLESIGIKNVINTSCPSMWNLTKDFCKKIPNKKSNKVVTTITDYCTDYEADNFMIKTLCNNYDVVYLFIQGDYDLQYIKTFDLQNNIIFINKSLADFDNLLENNDIDYVGTRLHAGIRALNHKRRTIIISIDNRAEEIAKDTNLPVIKRNEIIEKLDDMINSNFDTDIIIPEDNIRKWKGQFNSGIII